MSSLGLPRLCQILKILILPQSASKIVTHATHNEDQTSKALFTKNDDRKKVDDVAGHHFQYEARKRPDVFLNHYQAVSVHVVPSLRRMKRMDSLEAIPSGHLVAKFVAEQRIPHPVNCVSCPPHTQGEVEVNCIDKHLLVVEPDSLKNIHTNDITGRYRNISYAAFATLADAIDDEDRGHA